MYTFSLEGTEEPELRLLTFIELWRKEGVQKKMYFCFIDYNKTLTLWITINRGKFLKKWKYQTILPVSWESCMQVKKQQIEQDMEQ